MQWQLLYNTSSITRYIMLHQHAAGDIIKGRFLNLYMYWPTHYVI